jgi:hypothetical protein
MEVWRELTIYCTLFITSTSALIVVTRDGQWHVGSSNATRRRKVFPLGKSKRSKIYTRAYITNDSHHLLSPPGLARHCRIQGRSRWAHTITLCGLVNRWYAVCSEMTGVTNRNGGADSPDPDRRGHVLSLSSKKPPSRRW